MNQKMNLFTRRRAGLRLPVQHSVLTVLSRDFISAGASLRAHDVRALLATAPASRSPILITGGQGEFLGLIERSTLQHANSGALMQVLFQPTDLTARAYEDKYSVARRLLASDQALLPVLDSRQRILGVMSREQALALLPEACSQRRTHLLRRLTHRLLNRPTPALQKA